MQRRSIFGSIGVLFGGSNFVSAKYPIPDPSCKSHDLIACKADTVEHLRSYPVMGIRNGTLAFVAGQSEVDDGRGGIYLWDPHATVQDDNLNAVAPLLLKHGRWVRVHPASGLIAALQEATKQADLSSVEFGKGAALVGLKDSAAGSQASDSFNRLRELPISFMEFIDNPIRQDVRDGSNTADFAAAMQAFFTEIGDSGRIGYLPETPTSLLIGSTVEYISERGPEEDGYLQHGPKIIGRGPKKTVFKTGASNAAAFNFASVYAGMASAMIGLNLEGFKIENYGAVNSIGIRLYNQYKAVLRNIHVEGLSDSGLLVEGIEAGDSDTTAQLLVDGLFARSCGFGLRVSAAIAGNLPLSQSLITRSRVSSCTRDGIYLENTDGVVIDNVIVDNNGANGRANDYGGIRSGHNGLTTRNLSIRNRCEIANSNRAYNVSIASCTNGYIGDRVRFVVNDSDTHQPPVDIILGDGTNMVRNFLIEKPSLVSGTTDRTFLDLATNILPSNNVRLIDPEFQQFSESIQTLVKSQGTLGADSSRLREVRIRGLRRREPPMSQQTVSSIGTVTPSINHGKLIRVDLATVGNHRVVSPDPGLGSVEAGQEIVFRIRNTSGGKTKIIWSDAYLVDPAFGAPAAGKIKTGRFIWDNGPGKWVQLGDWSADLG